MLHHLVSPGGKVVAIDHIPQLVDWSIENLKKDGLGHALETGEVVVLSGDGRHGYLQEGVLYIASISFKQFNLHF